MSVASDSTIMTTAALQSRHVDVYREFFVHHDLVLSVPHVMDRWYGSSKGMKHGIRIKQKLPIKMYIGCIEIDDDAPWVHRWDAYMYMPHTASFQKTSIDLVCDASMLSEITWLCAWFLSTHWVRWANWKHWSRWANWATQTWYKISILSECSRGRGCSFKGTFCVWVSVLMHWNTWRIRANVFSSPEVYADRLESSEAASVRLLALQCNCAWRETTSVKTKSWLHAQVVLGTDAAPVVQMWARAHILDWQVHIDTPWHRPTLVSLKKYGIWVNDLPFDYGIFDFGVTHESNRISSYYAWGDDMSEWVWVWVEQMLADMWLNISKACVESGPSMQDIWNKLYMLMVYAWISMIKNNVPSRMRDFLEAIDRCGRYHSMVEWEKYHTVSLYSMFASCAQYPDERLALLPVSSSKMWGAFLFVCEKHKSRKTIEHMVMKFASSDESSGVVSRPLPVPIYMSWRDGNSADGAMLHHDVKWRLFSPLIPKNSVRYQWCDGVTYLHTHHYISSAKTWRVLLDTIYGKIYINGTKLTSKDLPSQKAVVDLMMSLLQEAWGTVRSHLLLRSAYSMNKNDMKGKVIVPFQKLIKVHFDRELLIRCTWSLYDFEVSLGNGYDLFDVVKKIF